jgi:glycine cleavage system H protein|tara:strand:- start:595 stop:1068 length:474 start_codon:yes stop_codon:yes gene_type:complete
LKIPRSDETGNGSSGGFIKYRRFDKSETDDMSEIPEGQYYTKEHEWLRVEGNEITIGITDHAQHALTDIVYIELPGEGEVLADMEEFAIVESVKSASPIFAPFAGEITAVNDALEDAPELMNSDPYGEGWIVRMVLEDPNAVSSLMDAAGYKAEIGE